MSTYRFANNASTTLGSSISPTDTTIVVASGTGAQFPAPLIGQYFTATLSTSATGLPNEIVRVTARVGDTMTVVRAQEGTTAQSWGVGARFVNDITAGFTNQLVDAGSLQAQAGNYAVDSGTANVGVVTLSPAPVNLGALIGVPVRVKKGGATSTNAYTLNVNSLGNVPVLIGGLALEGGELVASEIFEVVYDGTNFNLISNPGQLHGDRLSGNSVPNAALATMSSLTLKGNLGGGAATPYDVPLSALAAALGVFIVSYIDGVNWVKTYSNGVIEQGGYRTGTFNHEAAYTYSFNVPFPNAVNNVCIGAMTLAVPSNGSDGWLQEVLSSRSLTGFGIQVQSLGSSWGVPGVGFEWSARGN